MSIIHTILKAVRDFVLPQRCILCNDEIVHGMLCNNCLDYLPFPKPPLCHRCGRPIKNGQVCGYCDKKPYFDRGRAFMLFVPPADKIIHHFKYRKKTALATFLGRAMASIIRADHILQKADVIVPIPLFWFKRQKRGYNQASLLANVISSECGIENIDVLRRIRNTKTQTRLNEEARRKNVLDAFRVEQNGIKGKRVALVDDVMTTGVTINECARILKRAGAKEVYSCVAAITPG